MFGSTGSGILGKISGALFLLLAAAWVARQAYLWLLPLVPGLVALAVLLAALTLLVRLRRR
jgi:hypothetical protein